MKEIGIFSTLIEPAAFELIESVLDFIENKYLSRAQVAFVFSNKELGEDRIADTILQKLEERGVNLITFSATKYDSDLRKEAIIEKRKGNMLPLATWREGYGKHVLEMLPQIDFDLLLGDMYIWSKRMCAERRGVNLHPALPNGPKGKWYDVIWQLIRDRASESGVMMHRVSEELDRGPVITYSRFSLRGSDFNNLWQKLPTDEFQLSELIKRESVKRENADFPLHQIIRKHELRREIPLILQTVEALFEGKVIIEGRGVLDKYRRELL